MATQPRRTFADRKATKDDGEKFTVIVSGNLGPYKQGHTLSTDKHIAHYYRLAMNEGADEETTLTDEAILAGIKQVPVDGLDPDDADLARIAYLQGLSPDVLEDGVPGMNALVVNTAKAGALDAIKYGRMVDEEFQAIVLEAIEAKKSYDGSPVHLKFKLVDLFGEMTDENKTPVMELWPVIGTRKQDSKNDKGPPGMSVEDWKKSNLPADFYTVKTSDGNDIKGRWLGDFLAATPFGGPLAVRINMLKAAVNDKLEFPNGTPDDIRELRADNVEAQSRLSEAEGDWRNMLNRVGRAIQYWQQEQRVQSALKNCRVDLVGVDQDEDGNIVGMERAFKRNKPITLFNTATNKQSMPISLTKFLSLKTYQKVKSIAELLDTVKRGPKNPTPQPDQQKGGDIAKRIQNVHALGDSLNSAFQYLDSNETYGLVMKSIAASEAGGMIASRIVGLFDSLRPIAEDADVRKKADAYDKAQVAASAAADETAGKAKQAA